MIQSSTLKFLRDLKKNNNKPWFDAHRAQYDKSKAEFEQLITTLIKRHGKKDPRIASLKAKDCIFRINRDIRFSKDKSPYKTNFGASINAGGKRASVAGYYFHLDPTESFVGGGIWMPMAPELKKVRQEIDYCFDEFQKILNARKFKSVYGDLYEDQEIQLTRVPQGFEADSPASRFLKLKSFLAMKTFQEKEVVSSSLEKISLEAMETLQPLLSFINRALDHS